MPTDIKTAEQILEQAWDAENMDLQMCITLNPQVSLIKEAMHAYAKQFVHLTLQEAAEKAEMSSPDWDEYEINKSSILNLESEILNKIK